jgi:hypothetical protein
MRKGRIRTCALLLNNTKMKQFVFVISIACACFSLQAQTNFVKDPSLEQFKTCPNGLNQINVCRFWNNVKDTTTNLEYLMEYYNSCGNDSANYSAHVPINTSFYQYPHTGNGMAGATLFYDKTPPRPSGIIPFNYRDYLVGRLHTSLTNGQTYCVSFWVNLAETAGYGHNKIGAYLDNGAIHTIPDTPGNEIVSVRPQVYTNEVIVDTGNWVKIEGSFVANGTEIYISIGNFFPNDSLTTANTDYFHIMYQISYYLIDDISVIPIDLKADAGKDSHAEPSKPVQIGRVGDTTAQGLDCKWYQKGILIDSGAIISVNGAAIVGTVDTYVVLQTICGLLKTDTVTVTTVPVGMKELNTSNMYRVFPNPSNGIITITTAEFKESAQVKIYDLLGRMVRQKQLSFHNGTTTMNLDLTSGGYICEVVDVEGNSNRQRFVIE